MVVSSSFKCVLSTCRLLKCFTYILISVLFTSVKPVKEWCLPPTSNCHCASTINRTWWMGTLEIQALSSSSTESREVWCTLRRLPIRKGQFCSKMMTADRGKLQLNVHTWCSRLLGCLNYKSLLLHPLKILKNHKKTTTRLQRTKSRGFWTWTMTLIQTCLCHMRSKRSLSLKK